MYGEWLVLYNTVFNYVLLAFTNEVSNLHVRKRRLLLSAFLSGLVAVLFKTYTGSSLVSFLLLIVIAFGFRWRELIRRGVVIWIAALFIGGCLIYLQPILHSLSTITFLVVSGVIASATLYLFYKSWHYEKQQRLEGNFLLTTVLTIDELEIPILSYVDTGNVCVEPLSGKPVHFVSYETVAEYLQDDWLKGLESWDADNPYEISMLPTALMKRIRFIRLSTVQEGSTIALGIRFNSWVLSSPTHKLVGEYVILTRNANKYPKNARAILHVSALLNDT